MKSIIEEASSITKAVESAWKQANQPMEFSVRIFELPQRNIFGFTTKSAKIGIFFEESKKSEKAVVVKPQPQPAKEKEIIAKPAPVAPAKNKKVERELGEPWNNDMVTYVNDWFKKLFEQLNVDRHVTIKPEKYHLRISFNKALFDQEEKNKAFYRSSAHLLLQSVRNAFKRPLKGFKVILSVE